METRVAAIARKATEVNMTPQMIKLEVSEATLISAFTR